jgi:hypothetical protein
MITELAQTLTQQQLQDQRLNCLSTAFKLPCSPLSCCSNAVRVCPGLPAIPPNAMSNWNASCTNLTAGSNCTLGCAADSTGIGYTALCLNGNWTVTGACVRKQRQQPVSNRAATYSCFERHQDMVLEHAASFTCNRCNRLTSLVLTDCTNHQEEGASAARLCSWQQQLRLF